MLIQLLLIHTSHFVLNVFSAFVFFAAGLLYFDSWQVDMSKKTPFLRSVGFFVLAVAGIFHAISLDHPQMELFVQLVKTFGLFMILVSLIFEPIIHLSHKQRSSANLGKHALFVPIAIPVLISSLMPLSAILMLSISATYFRKFTEGLERQLKPAFIAFLFLGLSEVLRIPFYWSNTQVLFWSKILAPYGILWNIHHSFELIGIVILAVWVWGYIRFRLQLQLFVGTVFISLVIFLTTTVFFTFMLLKNLENDVLAHLKTDVNVLQYSLESAKERTLAYAQTVAQDESVREAFEENNKTKLYILTTDYMIAQKTNTLVIASVSGEVVMRAEDKDRTNDRLDGDPVVQYALKGQELATVSYDEDVVLPQVSVKAAFPIREDGEGQSGKIIGVVTTSTILDSTFVDGVRSVTGLDATIFAKDKRVATTLIAPDGKSRFVGTLETNKKVLDTVLQNGEVYIGAAQVLNLPFYTAYAPLKAHDGTVIGMLFVGKLQNTLTDTAETSINLTFLGSLVLIVFSLIPAYLFSKFLKEQLEA